MNTPGITCTFIFLFVAQVPAAMTFRRVVFIPPRLHTGGCRARNNHHLSSSTPHIATIADKYFHHLQRSVCQSAARLKYPLTFRKNRPCQNRRRRFYWSLMLTLLLMPCLNKVACRWIVHREQSPHRRILISAKYQNYHQVLSLNLNYPVRSNFII